MLTEMVEYGRKIKEKMKAMKSEIKENVQGTNSDGKETGTQINNLEQKKENIQPEQNKETRIKKSEIKTLSEISLGNIFSHTVGSLFILLMFSLAMQTLFILKKSHLFILSFMSLAPGDILVKILLRGISEIFLPMFSSRTFMVL